MYTYLVRISDNFHHMDQGEEYDLGEFACCNDAILACKKVVDDFLLSTAKPHQSYEELWTLYTTFGDDPFLITQDPNCRFSGWDYARKRCQELTEGNY